MEELIPANSFAVYAFGGRRRLRAYIAKTSKSSISDKPVENRGLDKFVERIIILAIGVDEVFEKPGRDFTSSFTDRVGIAKAACNHRDWSGVVDSRCKDFSVGINNGKRRVLGPFGLVEVYNLLRLLAIGLLPLKRIVDVTHPSAIKSFAGVSRHFRIPFRLEAACSARLAGKKSFG